MRPIYGLLWTFFSLHSASPSHAVDGVIEIDQTLALAGGVTPRDGPGFSVTISRANSYRLTGNLDRSGAALSTHAIDIEADDVTLDLGGFAILGESGCRSTKRSPRTAQTCSSATTAQASATTSTRQAARSASRSARTSAEPIRPARELAPRAHARQDSSPAAAAIMRLSSSKPMTESSDLDRSSLDRPANRLATETSAYLRQHRFNPVDWYPWGDEALRRARKEDRPILVSIPPRGI